jgi:cysteine synthase A
MGRYVRYRGLPTRLCVAEPAGGSFAVGWRDRDPRAVASRATLVEGIGRPKAEPGFVFDVVDAVVEIEDVDSIAAMRLLESVLGRRYGGSSGTNLAACMHLAQAMQAHGETGSIITLLCDRGERYAETLFDDAWLAAHGIDPVRSQAQLSSRLLAT